MRDSKRTRLGKPCHICGNVGFTNLIVTCFECREAREHTYCMRVPFSTLPEIWLCEICRSINGMAHNKTITRILHFASQSQPVCSNSLSGAIPCKNGKVKVNSLEEAMEISSRTQKAECSVSTNLSPWPCRISFSQTISKRSLTKVVTEPAKCSSKVAKTSSDTGSVSEILGSDSVELSQEHSSQTPARLKHTAEVMNKSRKLEDSVDG